MNPGVNSINDTLISFVKVFDGQGVFDSSFIAQVITCSYDPNNKEGQPLGQSSFHYIPLGDSIEYTIHFQNLGNDTALNIFIIDTLDEKFNHDSFEFLSSSHDCHIDIDKDGRATFSFYNIMLPCSLHNEFESVGFIKYRLYPKNTVSHGDVVVNKANIFFDFNPAIETNTTIHTYLNPSLYISSITYNADFIIYPNPFSDYITCNIPMKPLESSTVVIFDTRGKVLLRANNVKSGEQISLK
jgi:uncharacterized repeat protein (TIGR01451 family)